MSDYQAKAVALISGGLDSLLAAKIIQDQGVHVEGINFYTGFCVEGHTHAIRRNDKNKQKRNNALWVAEQLGIKLHIIDIVEEYKDVVINPRHGYGAHLNPCMDCKVFMVGKAKAWLEEHGFDFIITGEVIGQRPMSQLAKKMPVIAKRSGAHDRLLRPLCAKNLPPTLPEEKGWVDRDKLFDFSGRGRKRQIALAQQLGFHDYAQPAGGCCFLTDKQYSEKLRDLWRHRGEKRYDLNDIMLLKVGRHLRISSQCKLIIGREEGENNFLEGYRKQFMHIRVRSHKGPLVLIEGEPNAEELQLARRIVARYSSGREADAVELVTIAKQGAEYTNTVVPLPLDEMLEEWNV